MSIVLAGNELRSLRGPPAAERKRREAGFLEAGPGVRVGNMPQTPELDGDGRVEQGDHDEDEVGGGHEHQEDHDPDPRPVAEPRAHGQGPRKRASAVRDTPVAESRTVKVRGNGAA